MRLIKVVDFKAKRCWEVLVSEKWIKDNPADAPVSIGYVLGEDINERQLKAFQNQKKVRELNYKAECETPKPW